MTDLILLPPGALRARCEGCGFRFTVTTTSYRGDPIWFRCPCHETTFLFAPASAA